MGLLIMDCVIEAQSSRETIYGSRGKNEEEGKKNKAKGRRNPPESLPPCGVKIDFFWGGGTE